MLGKVPAEQMNDGLINRREEQETSYLRSVELAGKGVVDAFLAVAVLTRMGRLLMKWPAISIIALSRSASSPNRQKPKPLLLPVIGSVMTCSRGHMYHRLYQSSAHSQWQTQLQDSSPLPTGLKGIAL